MMTREKVEDILETTCFDSTRQLCRDWLEMDETIRNQSEVTETLLIDGER